MTEYKPYYKSFVTLPTVLFTTIINICCIPIVIGVFLVFSLHLHILGILLLAIQIVPLLFYLATKVAYKKETYQFDQINVYSKGGGILSNSQTELHVKNITYIKKIKPFLEYNIMKTGSIQIYAVGTKASAITLRNLKDVDKWFEYIQHMMRYSKAYTLSKSSVMQQEKPSKIWIGVITTITALITSLFFAPLASIVVVGALEVISRIFEFSVSSTIIVLISLASFLLWVTGVFVVAVLAYRQQTRHTFTLYNDAVDHSGGYLSKSSTIIPLENITDSSSNQSFLENIFGVYNFGISCQGVSSEISFHSIEKGKTISENIKIMSQQVKKIQEEKEEQNKNTQQQATQTSIFKKNVVAPNYQQASNTTYNLKRKFWPSMILYVFIIIISLAFPSWIVYSVLAFIAGCVIVLGTTYTVTPTNIEENFSFMSTKNKNLNYTKITRIDVNYSFIDRIFGTQSLSVYSLGSAGAIYLKNIERNEALVKDLFVYANMPSENYTLQIQPKYSIIASYLSNIVGSIISLLVVAGLIYATLAEYLPTYTLYIIAGLFVLSLAVLPYNYAKYKRTQIQISANTLHAQKGLLNIENQYVRLDYIKDMQYTKYLFTTYGHIKANVAGEITVQGKNNTQTAATNNTITVAYIPNIFQYVDVIDSHLYGTSFAKQPAKTTKAQAKNAVTIAVLVCTILIVTIPLLPIVLLLIAIYYKRLHYSLEPIRIVKKYGIINTHYFTMLYRQIDHITHKQGPLQTTYKNGAVVIYTAGQSTAELTIKNIKDHVNIYRFIENEYKKYK